VSKKPRRHHPTDQKVAMLKRHHLEKVPVSDLCDEAKVQPSVFYYWQEQLFENASTAFDGPKRKASREQELEERIQQLEAKLARKDQVIAEVTEELVRTKKRAWGPLAGRWVPHDVRDVVIDFVRDWSDKTELPQERFIRWLELPRGKFFEWRDRYGKANEHNGKVPRDNWLLPQERQAILDFHEQNPLEG
jgi:transposase-like protein